MYTGLVCLVLFDARGSVDIADYSLPLASVLGILLLIVKYIPGILHRPHKVDNLCEDLLHMSTHASCVYVLPSAQNLQYACALHSICFLMQHRFLKPSAVIVHTVTVLWLVYAYRDGPRVSELKTFILAVACPHILDIVSHTLVQTKKFTVLYLTDV